MVINIRAGPADGSRPNANTAGIITRAASIAAIVSNTATFLAHDTTSSVFFK